MSYCETRFTEVLPEKDRGHPNNKMPLWFWNPLASYIHENSKLVSWNFINTIYKLRLHVSTCIYIYNVSCSLNRKAFFEATSFIWGQAAKQTKIFLKKIITSTVDGRNPAAPAICIYIYNPVINVIFTYLPYQQVRDVFHQQYEQQWFTMETTFRVP